MLKAKKLFLFNKRETIKQNRLMWEWLGKHPSKTKGDYPGLLKLFSDGKAIMLSCFLCHYAISKKIATMSMEHMCYFCPVHWEELIEVKAYFCENSYYAKWRSLYVDRKHTPLSNLRKRKILAMKIAHLSEKRLYIIPVKHPNEMIIK